MLLKANEVERYIMNEAGYQPVVLVYGPDSGLVSERTKLIISKLNNKSDDPFAVTTLESDAIANDPGLLMDELQNIGLFGERKIIKLRLNGSKSIISSLKVALEDISSDANLIIEAGNLNKNHSLRSLIEKSNNSIAIPCYVDTHKDLENIINQELSLFNLKIDINAKQALMNLLGESRQTSRNEIQKLALYAFEKKSININDVENLIGDSSISIIDEIIDHIFIGNIHDALKQYNKGLSIGVPSYQILHSSQQHILLLNKLVIQKEKNQNVNTLIEKVKPPIFFKRRQIITQQVYNWNSQNISKVQDFLLKTIAECRLKPNLSNNLTADFLLKLANLAKRNKNKF